MERKSESLRVTSLSEWRYLLGLSSGFCAVGLWWQVSSFRCRQGDILIHCLYWGGELLTRRKRDRKMREDDDQENKQFRGLDRVLKAADHRTNGPKRYP